MEDKFMSCQLAYCGDVEWKEARKIREKLKGVKNTDSGRLLNMFINQVQGLVTGLELPKPLEYYHEVLQRDVNAEGVVFVAGPTSYAEQDYKKIWEARIDGSVEPVIEKKGPGAEDENVVKEVPLEPLDSVVKVGMVLWSPDPLNRLIAVEYTSDGGGVAGGGTATKQRRLHLTQGEPLRAPYDGGRYMGKVPY